MIAPGFAAPFAGIALIAPADPADWAAAGGIPFGGGPPDTGAPDEVDEMPGMPGIPDEVEGNPDEVEGNPEGEVEGNPVEGIPDAPGIPLVEPGIVKPGGKAEEGKTDVDPPAG